MNVLTTLRCFIALLICVEIPGYVSADIIEKGVERPLRIGGFNIQNLGVSKLSNDEVMNIVEKIILRYDIILVQEIVTKDQDILTELLRSINSRAEEGATYDLELSERLGRRTAKEQYGYFYRKDKVDVLSLEVYPDTENDFMRPPYIAHFYSPTIDGLYYFIMIGIHTQPSNAANETSSLAQVYEYARRKYETGDAIILGDMNAGCATVRKGDWDNIDLWTDPTFEWLIGHDIDTTTNLNSCPYDRIVIAGENVKRAVIPNSAVTFNFQNEYGLTEEQTKSVSDHWPVELRLKGKLSEEARESISSSVCFEVSDNREVNDPMALHRARKKFDFQTTATKDDNGNYVKMTATRSSESLQELVSAFKQLSKKFSNVLLQETTEAVEYKAKYGALEDISANSNREDIMYHMEITCDVGILLCSVRTCRDTSIN